MSKEILHPDASGLTLYYQIVSAAGTYWSFTASAFEAYVAGRPLVELRRGAHRSRGHRPVLCGPAGISAGNYRIVIYLQSGSAPRRATRRWTHSRLLGIACLRA